MIQQIWHWNIFSKLTNFLIFLFFLIRKCTRVPRTFKTWDFNSRKLKSYYWYTRYETTNTIGLWLVIRLFTLSSTHEDELPKIGFLLLTIGLWKVYFYELAMLLYKSTMVIDCGKFDEFDLYINTRDDLETKIEIYHQFRNIVMFIRYWTCPFKIGGYNTDYQINAFIFQK